MASNHTTNYQLNQWAKPDRVMMDDFNTDNAKIDAALKANADAIAETAAAFPLVKIKEVTLGADTAQWDIDVSDINIAQYAFLLCFPALCASKGAHILYDNLSGSSDYYSSGNPKANAGSVFAQGRSRIDIQYADSHLFTTARRMTSLGIREETFTCSDYSAESGEGFQQLNLVSDSGLLQAGSTVTFYGLKK